MRSSSWKGCTRALHADLEGMERTRVNRGSMVGLRWEKQDGVTARREGPERLKRGIRRDVDEKVTHRSRHTI